MTPLRKLLIGSAFAGTALAGGALGASFLGTASAQTTTDPATTAPAAPAQPHQAPDWSKGGHQANGKTEVLLTGDAKTKAVAAAEAAVPGATVERAETDAEGATYEVHMTKSDGSEVTVKLDASFKDTDTLDGRG
jgi:hypothetical protein